MTSPLIYHRKSIEPSLSTDDHNALNCICEQNIEQAPTLEEINRLITESKVMENKEQSRQLFLLIQLFIQVKVGGAGEDIITKLPPCMKWLNILIIWI